MAAIAIILKALPYLATLVASLIALWKEVQRKDVSAGLEKTRDTLNALIAVIEALPQDDRTKALKSHIERVAVAVDVQGPVLASAVEQVSALVKQYNVASGSVEDDAERLYRVAKAVEAARLQRGRVRPLMSAKDAALPLGIIVLCAMFAVGCTSRRLTVETVWPGDTARRVLPEVIVEWPLGVASEDVITTTIQGVTLSTAPVFSVLKP